MKKEKYGKYHYLRNTKVKVEKNQTIRKCLDLQST